MSNELKADTVSILEAARMLGVEPSKIRKFMDDAEEEGIPFDRPEVMRDDWAKPIKGLHMQQLLGWLSRKGFGQEKPEVEKEEDGAPNLYSIELEKEDMERLSLIDNDIPVIARLALRLGLALLEKNLKGE